MTPRHQKKLQTMLYVSYVARQCVENSAVFKFNTSLICKIRLGTSNVRMEGLEPPCLTALDPKSSASTSSATPA